MSEPGPRQPPRLLRVVGPPGSGKSLLITSLVDSLRSRGYRSAAVVQRGEATTVITLSTGSRSTLDRSVPLSYLATVVGWVDPTVHLVLAEAYEERGAPAVELRPQGAPPYGVPEDELLAVVETEAIAAAFARGGPGDTIGLADRIERELLGGPGTPDAAPGAEGGAPDVVGRFLRRFRWPG
ncbi:MAG: hypothetical protein WD058_02415 [Dehalococcoidia bacterium]